MLGRLPDAGGEKDEAGRGSVVELSATVSRVGVNWMSVGAGVRTLAIADWKEVSSECCGVETGDWRGEGGSSVKGVYNNEFAGSVRSGVEADRSDA